MTRIAVIGAAGRMGRLLLEVIDQDDTATLVGAVVLPASLEEGQSVKTLQATFTSDILMVSDIEQLTADVDVLIDFSAPKMVLKTLDYCQRHQKTAVIGATGLSPEQIGQVEEYAQHVPFVFSANMSLGINILLSLVRQTAQVLAPLGFDIEIIEMHHRNKIDAPSGTALMLGEAVAQGLKQNLTDCAVFNRHDNYQIRNKEEIGFSSLRGGDIVGEHTVLFASNGERIEITHRATDRHIFARGAIQAAHWIKQQPAGHYDMLDVLNLY